MNTNSLPYFKSKFLHGGISSKGDTEKIYNLLKNITGENGVTVTFDYGRGIHIVGSSGDSPTNWQFGVTVSGKTITVQKGTVMLQGSDVAAIAYAGTTSAIATGEYCYPTIRVPIANIAGVDLQCPSAFPTPDSTYYYVPLVRLKATDHPTDENYVFDSPAHIYHRGIILLSNPLVYS